MKRNGQMIVGRQKFPVNVNNSFQGFTRQVPTNKSQLNVLLDKQIDKMKQRKDKR